MLKIGDTVKIISKTLEGDNMRELFPIGSIGRVTEDGLTERDGTPYYGITRNNVTFYYLENELEKGHMEWIAD